MMTRRRFVGLLGSLGLTVVFAAPASTGADEAVLMAKEIQAGRVVARVIYAKEVKAKAGRVKRIFEGRENKRWKERELKAAEVRADIIYAKEIKADWVEADEIHAKEVKIGR